MIDALAPIMREFMERSSAIMRVLATASQVDPDAAQLMDDIRQQRYVGQSRIVAALSERRALHPDLSIAKANDIAYTILSPDVHHILTAERGWTADQYELWLARSLKALLVSTETSSRAPTKRTGSSPATTSSE
jgi:hypothetical protein